MNNHRHLQRRRVLQFGGSLAAFACLPSFAADPFRWEQAEPGPGAIGPELAARLDQGVQSGEFANLHAVFIARKGKMVMERYFEGEDERWGTPLGKVRFDADTLHDVRSVSKSIVGLLYGIALAEGKVPALDTPLLDAFPHYADLAGDARRRRIRIVDVLTMTMGLEWNEDLPYSDPRNSEIAMERSNDRYRYVLDRPIAAEPGERWRYSGGATAILGHLVAKGSGMPLLAYAKEKLFSPMGIDQVEWTAGRNGEAAAASGLRMRAPDLARIGQLLLRQGEWDGRPLVAKDWISASLTPRAAAFDGLRYGYHWYVAQQRDGTPAYLAIGLGGQRLVVVPSLELVYVIFMGNYYKPDQLKPLFAVQKLIGESVR
ncbi:serine hydrolase [Variovorax sp. KK3]|uniref:serine hydrolase domain-containing protein n=1 Tax=Variovorax sp. KK3 TaxID=1855728 RepID=UPI0015C2F81C|nr:serine hydrolase [Variovorax sp. KK3]